MKSDRLRPTASAARSISAFCLRLARRLIVSPLRVAFFVPAPGIAVLLVYTTTIQHCNYVVDTRSPPTPAPVPVTPDSLSQLPGFVEQTRVCRLRVVRAVLHLEDRKITV